MRADLKLTGWILLLVWLAPLPLCARSPKLVPTLPDDVLFRYHKVVPLGATILTLKPANQSFYVLASAVGTDFEGWKIVGTEESKQLVDASGVPVKRYPRRVDFRISASSRTNELFDIPKEPVRSRIPLGDYLLGLRFRVKVFDGLDCRSLDPAVVRMIGVPAYIPYNERIYQVGFNLGDIPASRRLVLEVLSPSGDRIAKFHLDLY